MQAPDSIDDLRRDVQYLKDRLEILDCVSSLSRGTDRHDADQMTRAFHPDGWDAHGTDVVVGTGFAESMNATHAAGSQATLHHVTTHTCEITGDVTHAESYVIGTILNPDGVTARILCGRYIDRLERRDGVWGIVVRHSTVEFGVTADASLLTASAFTDRHFAKGARDATDLSYERPLEVDSPSATW